MKAEPDACSQTLSAGEFGERPLFLALPSAPRGATRASRCVLDVVPQGAQVDPLGLATLLCLGFPLGSRTVFAGVTRADPGVLVRVADGSVVCAGSWPNVGTPPASPEALHELLLESVRRGVAGVNSAQAPLVALSGGRDSRLIYLSLRALGVRPRRVLTIGGAGESPDARVARELARRLGDPIEHVRGLRFDAARDHWRHAHQNLESLEHSWFLSLALRARALGGPITDGIGAGVLSTGSLMHPEAVALWKRGSLDELAEWTFGHAAGTTAGFRSAVRTVGIALASDDEVRDALVATFRGLGRYPNPLGAFSLLNWTRRGISASAFGLLPSESVVAPLFDAQLVSSLLGMDLEQAMQRDWREVVLERCEGPGVPFAESRMQRPRMRFGSWLGSRAWGRFEADCGISWKPLFDAQRTASGGRKSFIRSAIGMLRVLTGR